MDLKNDRELEVTREKLRLLETWYDAEKKEPSDNEYLRELTLRSLKRHINQLTEEIIRYEARKTSKQHPETPH